MEILSILQRAEAGLGGRAHFSADGRRCSPFTMFSMFLSCDATAAACAGGAAPGEEDPARGRVTVSNAEGPPAASSWLAAASGELAVLVVVVRGALYGENLAAFSLSACTAPGGEPAPRPARPAAAYPGEPNSEWPEAASARCALNSMLGLSCAAAPRYGDPAVEVSGEAAWPSRFSGSEVCA